MSEIDDNEFVDIPEYEGYYQINRKGEVKSLERYSECGRLLKEKILKNNKDNYGYFYIDLRKVNKRKKYRIHCLLYKVFNCYYDCKYFEIDHINRIREDNRLENLRIVTIRNNNNNRIDQSLFGCGVSKMGKKYRAIISINLNSYHLGTFETQEQASQKYLSIKSQIEEIEKITHNYTFNRYKKDGEYFIEFYPIL